MHRGRGNDNTKVSIPFQLFVNDGESTFGITVPRHYDIVGGHNHRKFHFAQLCITPAYYSQKASQLDLTTKAEDDEQVPVALRSSFNINSASLYRGDGDEELRWENTGGRLDAVIKNFNTFFDTTSKPAGFKGSPCFIDWIDTEWDLPTDEEYYATPMDFDEWVGELLNIYYMNMNSPEEEVSIHDHYDALEESNRGIWNVNNYAFPTNALDPNEGAFLEHFRLRLHLAPNTSIQFSSNDLLSKLGFTKEQTGRRGRMRRFFFDNPNTDQYLIIVADSSPILATINKTPDKVNVSIYEKRWTSKNNVRTMRLGEFRDNDALQQTIDSILDDITLETNIDVGLRFNATTTMYEFVFPDNRNIDVTLHVSKELSNRLGCGPGVTKITRETIFQPVVAYGTITDAELLAKTLVYDTGMVLVTLDSQSSITTMGTSEYFMACLWPTSDGRIVMTPQGKDGDNPAIYLPSSGAVAANVIFNIWVYNEDGTIRRLDWKTGLYVAGILQGTINGQ